MVTGDHYGTDTSALARGDRRSDLSPGRVRYSYDPHEGEISFSCLRLSSWWRRRKRAIGNTQYAHPLPSELIVFAEQALPPGGGKCLLPIAHGNGFGAFNYG